MSSGKVEKYKTKKNYHNAGRKKRNGVEINDKGFLCSCNNREKECIREAYNLLNKTVENLYKSEPITENTEGGDISDEIAKEIQDLKSNTVKNEHKFNVCDSGAKNLLFIRSSYENPVEIAEKIVTDISNSKEQQTRFLLRLIPIETVCKSYLNDIEKSFEQLAEKYFKNEAKCFSIVYNHRNNNSLSKDDVIKAIADKITSLRSDHKVDLKNPEVSVIVEVIRGLVFMGVVPNFFKFKKYNLLSLCEKPEEPNERTVVENEGANSTTENE